MKKYLFLLLIIMIGLVSARGLVVPEQPINYSLIPTVNSSDYWDDRDTPADITYDEISGGDVNALGYTGTFNFIKGVSGQLSIDGNPWYLAGVDLEIADNFKVDGNSTANCFKASGDANPICNLSALNQTTDLTGYAKYQFEDNNFNGSGNFTTTGKTITGGASGIGSQINEGSWLQIGSTDSYPTTSGIAFADWDGTTPNDAYVKIFESQDDDLEIQARSVKLGNYQYGPGSYIEYDSEYDKLYASSGTFDFDNDDIITTGTGTFGNLDVDTLNLNGNVITDSTGTISFDDEDITTTGNVGIGIAPRYPLHMQIDVDASSDSQKGFYNKLITQNAGGGTGVIAMEFNAAAAHSSGTQYSVTGAGGTVAQWSRYPISYVTGLSGTVESAAGERGNIFRVKGIQANIAMLSGDLTVSEALGINVDIGAGSASTLTKAIGINVKSFTKSTGSIGTAYGLYLEEQTNGATNYQVYSPAGNWDLGTGDITTTGNISGGTADFGDGGTTNYTEITATGSINQKGSADFDTEGRISSASLTVTSSADNTDVSGVNTVWVTTTGGDVVLGGLTGGVDGQVLYVIRKDTTNDLTLENAEGAGD